MPSDDHAELADLYEGWEFQAVPVRAGESDVPLLFWETYSAMANGGGGIIALGVRDHGRTPQIEGVRSPDELERELSLQLQGRDRTSVNVLTQDDVHRFHHDGHLAVVVRVRSAPRTQRPVYLGRDPFGQASDTGAYLRVRGENRRLPPERVKRMFADALEGPFDATALGWVPRRSMRDSILAACQHEYRTPCELASALNRKRGTIARHIRDMVKQGALIRRYHEPTHPRQVYRSTDPESQEQG